MRRLAGAMVLAAIGGLGACILPAVADAGRGKPLLLAVSNEVRSMCEHARRLINSRRFPEAFEILHRALAIEPACAEAHSYLGTALQNSDNTREAIDEYQRALQLDPSMTFLYLNIGNCYLNLEEPDAAAPYLERFGQLNPREAARVQDSLREARESRDRQAFRQMVEQGDLALDQRKFAEARRRFEQVVAMKPNYAHGHFQLGYAWISLGDNQRAVQEFQVALQLDPSMKEAVLNIASSYQSLGDTASAIAWYERYLSMNPPAAEADSVKKSIALLRKSGGKQMGSPELPDYLDDSAQEGGSFLRWPLEKLPLRVFTDSGSSVEGYRDSFRLAFDEALAAWQKGCGYRLSFAQASSAAEADIVVNWSSDSAGVKGESTGAEAGIANLEIKVLRTGERMITGVKITLLTIEGPGGPVTDESMKKTCLHEIGHALGIRGHSSNNRDVMFFSESGSVWPSLTKRDKATLTRLYADYPPQGAVPR